MSFQLTVVTARLARDPELKAISKDAQVCKLSLPVNEKWDGGEHTEWFNVDVFGKSVDACMKYLHRGSWVTVYGTLRTREHEGKKYTTLRAQSVRFVGNKEDAPAAATPPAELPADKEATLDNIPF